MDLKTLDTKKNTIIIGGKYCLKERLGGGSFGQIYLAVNIENDHQVAVKLERKGTHTLTLQKEARVLSELLNETGFPNIYHYGKEDYYCSMVMSLLGLNLEKLFKLCHLKLSLKTVLMVWDQMLTRIEVLHEKGFIHRDIKPENFCIGNGHSQKTLYMIDFGLSCSYKDSFGKHIQYREGRGLVGTARYASVNTHQGVQQSRRDDLESIGYVIIYLTKGKLPWQSIKAATKQEKYRLIYDMKKSTSLKELCFQLPKQFLQYMEYCRCLNYYDTPNYKYLKKLVRQLYLERSFEHDDQFDWSELLRPQKTSQMQGRFQKHGTHLQKRQMVEQLPANNGGITRIMLSQQITKTNGPEGPRMQPNRIEVEDTKLNENQRLYNRGAQQNKSISQNKNIQNQGQINQQQAFPVDLAAKSRNSLIDTHKQLQIASPILTASRNTSDANPTRLKQFNKLKTIGVVENNGNVNSTKITGRISLEEVNQQELPVEQFLQLAESKEDDEQSSVNSSKQNEKSSSEKRNGSEKGPIILYTDGNDDIPPEIGQQTMSPRRLMQKKQPQEQGGFLCSRGNFKKNTEPLPENKKQMSRKVSKRNNTLMKMNSSITPSNRQDGLMAQVIGGFQEYNQKFNQSSNGEENIEDDVIDEWKDYSNLGVQLNQKNFEVQFLNSKYVNQSRLHPNGRFSYTPKS